MAKKTTTKTNTSVKYQNVQPSRNQSVFKELSFTAKQKSFQKTILNSTITICQGTAGTSKAQPLNTPILTDKGFITMGNVTMDTKVATVDGSFTAVTGIFPQGLKTIYDIKFTDGTSTQCCDEHLWFTKTKSESEYSVKNTLDIIKTLDYIHEIPLCEPISFEEQIIKCNPYLFGILLGCGNFRNNITIKCKDENIINEFLHELHYIRKNEYLVTDNDSEIKKELIENYLYDVEHNHYYIPDNYLYNSVSNRILLLQGICDSMAKLSTTGNRCTINSTSQKLIESIINLVQSLGGITKYTYKAKTNLHQIYINLPKGICPFLLSHKKNNYKYNTPKKIILSVTKSKTKEFAQCIRVEHPSHLYLTNSYIVTHNTFSACFIALRELHKQNYDKIILCKPIQESGENLGFLPGTVDEKIAPYFQSYWDNIEQIMEIKHAEWLRDVEKKIVLQPLAYMRGRTFRNSIIIVDECFSGDSKICTGLKDGSRSINYMRILDIYNNFKKGKDISILSYNETTGNKEMKLVTNVFEKEEKELYKIHLKNYGSINNCTDNHPIAIYNYDGSIGYTPAIDLKENDLTIQLKHNKTNNNTIMKTGYDVLLGFLLGDGCLSKNNSKQISYRFTKTHGLQQEDYAIFCSKLFNVEKGHYIKSGYTGKPLYNFASKSLTIPKEFIDSLYVDNKKKISENIEQYFTKHTLATWYMDDGSFSKHGGYIKFHTEGFSYEENVILKNILKNKFNLDASIDKYNRNDKEYYYLRLLKESSKQLLDLIKDLIHPDLQYKLPNYECNFDSSLYDVTFYDDICAVPVDRIEKLNRKEKVYNLEVEGNNNYFVNKSLVHNCQNCSIEQLIMVITRLGANSKLILCGDVSQHDINKKFVALPLLEELFDNLEVDGNRVSFFKFLPEDVVRHPLLIEITDRYEKWKYSEKGQNSGLFKK